MQDLTLVGLSEDKSTLVLVSDSGEEFALPADARLRAALRGDHARTGKETKMDSALRPRDIQARIRAGESPEAVADAAQTTVDRIMGYATPVLAERAHIADRALRASVRRRGGDGPGRILYDAAAEQLRAQNIDPDSVDWDSWRREDGRWTVVADYEVSGRRQHAKFTFDVHGRYVVAENDDSRWLVGEPSAHTPPPQPRPSTGRRLSAVGRDDQLPLGDDAIELVTDPGQGAGQGAGHGVGDGAGHGAGQVAGQGAEPGAGQRAEPGAEEATVDLSQTAREVRRGTTVRIDELAAAGDADWMATQASDRPRRRDDAARTERSGRPGSGQDPAQDRGRRQEQDREQDREVGSSESPERAAAPEPSEEPAEEPSENKEAAEPAPKKAGRKGRRASVPSWDEIMFGGGRSE